MDASFEMGTIISLIALSYYILGGVLVIYFRNHDWILKRHPPLLAATMISCFLSCSVFLTNTLQEAPRNLFFEFPCNFQLAVLYIFPSIWLLSYLLRCIHLVYLYSLEHHRLSKLENISTTSMGEVNGTSRMNRLRERFVRAFVWIMERILHWGTFFFPSKEVEVKASLSHDNKNEEFGPVKHRSLLVATAIVIVFDAGLIVLQIVMASKYKETNTIGCTPVDYLPVLGMVGLFILLIPFFLYLIKPMEDIFWIKNELSWCIGLLFPSIILFVLASFVFKLGINPDLWLAVVAIASYFTSVYIPIFKLTRNKEKIKEVALSLTYEYLDIVLENPVMLSRLKTVATKEFNIENLMFIITFNKQQALEKREGRVTSKEDLETRRSLYEDYILRNSKYELNLPFELVTRTIKAVSDYGEVLLIHLNPVYQYTRTMFLINTFANYVQSGKEK